MALVSMFLTVKGYIYTSLVLFSLVICFIATKAKNALSNPLNTVPGPTLAKWTNLRLKLAVLNGSRMQYIHDLHERYGHVVRISPNELSFSDLSAVKEIYRVHGLYRKSDWYTRAIPDPEPNLFTMIDFKAHAARRTLFAHSFSSGWLMKVEGQVYDKVYSAVSNMKREIKEQGSTDILKWWTFQATDVTGELSFGESFHMLELGKVSPYRLKVVKSW